jgi:hypothetical protein
MAPASAGKPPGESAKLSPEQEEGLNNLERLLKAQEQDGRAGLNRELDKLFPGTQACRIPLGPDFPNSSAGLQPAPQIPTVPYLGKTKLQP